MNKRIEIRVCEYSLLAVIYILESQGAQDIEIKRRNGWIVSFNDEIKRDKVNPEEEKKYDSDRVCGQSCSNARSSEELF